MAVSARRPGPDPAGVRLVASRSPARLGECNFSKARGETLLAATIVHANVNSLGEAYKDQTPSVKIRVRYSRANGQPYRAGERVSVKLKIGKRWYDGKLHTSAGTKFVYSSPTLARNGTETTLGHVLKKFGVGVNERVQLRVTGTRIQMRDK